MIQSVLIKSYPSKKFKYPTLSEMHASQFTKYQKFRHGFLIDGFGKDG
jgi:hypothetical protein